MVTSVRALPRRGAECKLGVRRAAVQGPQTRHVVRAVVVTDCAIEPALDEPFVCIDDRDFTLREFFKMVGAFGGWGMRIAFVGDDETHEQPKIKVREPREPKRSGRRSKAL